MTNADESLYDVYLKTALEHAPDHHAQASDDVRKQVLNYAKQATTSQFTWFSRLKNWLLKDHFSNAQWASFTGVAAMLLVAVLLWRQHPEDAVWISATPKDVVDNSPASAKMPAEIEDKIHQNSTSTDLPAAPVTIEASRDSALKTLPSMAKEQSSNQQMLEAKKVDLSASKKAQLNASASAESLGQLDDAQSQSAKKELPKTTTNEHAQVEGANVEAPVVAMAAPAPVTSTRPTLTETTGETLSKQKPLVRGLNNKKMENSSISADTERSNTASINEEASKQPATSTHILEPVALSNALVAQGGQAIAQHDIKVGIFRLLQVKPQQDSLNIETHECKQSSTADTVDAQTNYKVETLAACEHAEALIKAVELYNQTMKNWYLQHQY